MKEIIYNKDNLKDNELDETVIRIKAVIINNKDEILLGKCHNTYQFPGGHLNPKEDLTTGLIREVKEETGIELTNVPVPVAFIKNYTKNYHNTGKNLGGAGGFHIGIKLAVESGYDYVWIMDDDCIVHNDSLTALLSASENLNDNFGYLSSQVLWQDNTPCKMNTNNPIF